MSSTTGNKIKVTLFGQSHSPGMGVVVDGLPAGEKLDLERIGRFMARRAPGQGPHTTARREADRPEILSGLTEEDHTCGAPLCAVISNTDARSRDYDQLRRLPRPGHADYAAWAKFGPYRDIRGGGEFSGRLTAPLCFAGAVCIQLLERRGVGVGGHLLSVAKEKDRPFDPVAVTARELAEPGGKTFPVLDDAAGERMLAAIARARAAGDSVGGVVECCALGVPPGTGETFFGGLESRISALMFSIPAVKGVEFGAGFEAATLRGSENNDEFYFDPQGRVCTRTNRHGGILGGLASGMPLVVRAAFKPTPSIALEQRTVDLESGRDALLRVEGRHDPCVAPRAVPVAEAALAVALADLLL